MRRDGRVADGQAGAAGGDTSSWRHCVGRSPPRPDGLAPEPKGTSLCASFIGDCGGSLQDGVERSRMTRTRTSRAATTPWSRSLSGATGRGGLRTSTTTTSPSSLGGARTSPRRWATTGMLGHLGRARLWTRLCLSSCVQGRCSSREWVLGVVARRAPQHAPNHHWLRGRCGM